MYFTNRWACGSEKIKKGKGKTHFAKSVGAALIIAAASLAAFTGCPQDGNGIELPADPIDIVRDGISFRTQGEFTRAEAAAITAIINNLNLSAFQGLVSSLTIMANGALSITLTEGNKAVIYTSDATVEGIVAALTAGRDKAYAAQNPGNGNGDNGQDPNDVIVTTPTSVDNEGIDFIIRAGLTQGQVTALTALINGLDIGDYAGYVETVRLNQGVEGGRIIDVITRDGVNATAVIYIDYDATIEEIMNALAAAMAEVQAVRDAALDAEFWTTIEPNPTNFTHGGVGFSIAGNLLTRGEIRDITAMVEGTTLTEFAGFITSVEFARNVPDGLRIVRGDGEQATASITIEHDADQDALENAFNEALAEVIAERERARLAREAEEERIAANAEAAFRAANPIVDGPQQIGGITFTLAGAANFDTRNSADMAIISAITTALGNLNIPAPTFVTGVTFSMDVTGAPIIQTTTGENATATVTMSATQATTGAVADAITAGHDAAAAIRNDWIFLPGTHIDTNREGIDFATGGSALTNGQINAIQGVIDGLNATDLAAFANYVQSWTLQVGGTPGTNVQLTSEANPEDIRAMITRTVADAAAAANISIADILADLEEGQDDASYAQNFDPYYVDSIRGPDYSTTGNTIRIRGVTEQDRNIAAAQMVDTIENMGFWEEYFEKTVRMIHSITRDQAQDDFTYEIDANNRIRVRGPGSLLDLILFGFNVGMENDLLYVQATDAQRVLFGGARVSVTKNP